MDLINISNIPSSKAYFDSVFEIVLNKQDRSTIHDEVAEMFFQQKGHVRKVINHLTLLGLLKSKNSEIMLTKNSNEYLDKKISFDEMILKGVFTSEAVSDFAKAFINICLVYGEPIPKKQIDDILSILFLERDDKSAVASIARNTRSLVNLLEWTGLIHKSQQSVLCPSSVLVHKKINKLDNMYVGPSLFELDKKNENVKKDISEITHSLKNNNMFEYWQNLLSAIVAKDQLYNWSVTSFSNENINVANKFGQRIRYFVRK